MSKHAKKMPFIEIEIININLDEREASRKHIRAEGNIPSSIVALFSFLPLGTFDKIGHRFLFGIKSLIEKLRKHNYLLATEGSKGFNTPPLAAQEPGG